MHNHFASTYNSPFFLLFVANSNCICKSSVIQFTLLSKLTKLVQNNSGLKYDFKCRHCSQPAKSYWTISGHISKFTALSNTSFNDLDPGHLRDLSSLDLKILPVHNCDRHSGWRQWLLPDCKTVFQEDLL